MYDGNQKTENKKVYFIKKISTKLMMIKQLKHSHKIQVLVI